MSPIAQIWGIGRFSIDDGLNKTYIFKFVLEHNLIIITRIERENDLSNENDAFSRRKEHLQNKTLLISLDEKSRKYCSI